MSDEIFFDGKRYISANDAAVSSDLTRDYVARLCRDGRVAGRRIGKNWYVDHASLAHFLVTQEFAKSNRNESLTHERIREYHGENVPRPKANTTALSAVASTAPHVSRVISGRADEIKNKMAAAVAGQTRGVLGQTRQFLNTPGGLAHAAFQIVPAQVGTHIPSYTLTPVMEFFHKVVALTTAVMLVFGTYAAVDPAYAQFAANSVRDNISAALDSYHEAMSGGPRAFVARAQLQVAAAAGDPEGTFASIASFLPRTAASLARSFHKSINSAFYTVAFPNSLTQRSIIAVEVTPYANDTKSAVRAEPSTVRPNASGPTTIINNPVVERVVETTRLVSVGGISEEILNKKISELDAKLSAQLSGLAAANSTQVTNVYAAAASVANIDHLKGLDLESGTIRGGTITNTAVSAKSLAVTGTGTSTAANGFDISDGCFAIDGVCISGSGGGSSFGQSWELLGGVLSPTTSVPILVNNATSTITNLVTVNATSTNATTTTFAIGSLTGPLQANSGVVSATSTLSPAYGGTGNSTFAIGDILYASAAGTLSRLSVGSTGQVLKVSAGLPSWGADAQGSGGTGAWATSTDNLLLYPATVSNVVVIGQSATTTTGNILEVAGASLFRGSLVMHGIGTASSFTATSTTASVFPYASSTALTVSGTASTSILRIDNLSSGGLAIRADGQVYSAATSTLSTISGTLALTQLASQAANTVVANLTGGSAAPTAISTTSLFAGTNGQILAFSGGTWTGVATTTFSTGLTYASGNTTCDTASDSVFGCLTSASFSKFNSATTTFTNGLSYSAGAASLAAIAANSILANVTGASAVPTALATSSFFSLTGATTITYASSTATSVSGTASSTFGNIGTLTLTTDLTVANGGTGASTLTGLLQGNGTSAFTAITDSSTVGQTLRVTGASTYAWGALDLADTDAVTGDLPFANLAQVSANSILGNITGSTGDAASISTSSLFAAGTAGNVLTYTTAGTWVPSATTTFSTGVTYANGAVTCDSASASVFGCLTSASFSKFNSATTTFSTGLTYSAGNVTNTGVTSNVAGAGISVSGATGAVTITNAYGYPFTSATTYSTLSQGTSTPLWLQGTPYSLFASSTAIFSNASTTQLTTTDQWFTGLSAGALAVDASGKVYKGATSTLSTISGTLALTQLASQAANTVVANLTGGSAAPTAISTTSLFAGTNGQILAFSGGTWTGVATTTFSTGLTYASGNTTCDTASDSVFGCLTSASFSKFNSATTTFTNGLSYSAGAASLAAIAANSILANVTGASAVPTALATSSFFSLTGATTITYASSTAITSSGSGYFATSGGSVGVGTTSPWGLLSVNPSGISGPAFAIGSSTMTQFVVTNGSNVGNSNLVGVGTTSPWATFAIEQQASTTASFVVSDSGTSTPFLLVDGKGNIGLGTSTPYGLLTLYKTGSTAAASPQLVFSASSTISGVGNFLNNWAVGTDFNDGGKFKISSSSVIGTNDRFVIDGSGNVGIGTTTPWSNVNSVGSTLDLTSSGVVRLSMHDTAGTQEGSITANNAGLNLRVAGAATASNNIITFWTGNTNSDFTMSERMRIDSAGNIGIGTTTPQWLLNPFSATASQLALSAGAGIGQWAFRNAGGNFYLASTTADGTATSTTALFSITNASTTIANALYSGSLATSSFANGVNLTGGCFSINGTCVGGGGSGTVTSIATNDGLTGGTITTSGTIGLAAIAANSILANVTGASAVPTALATSSFFSLTGATTITYASSTATSVSGTASSTFGNIGTLTLTTDLSVANGGTGASTLTGLLQGNGTSAFTAITDSSTAGQVLRVTGASTYAWGALDLADTDAVTGDLPFSNLAQVSANSILGNITGSTGDAASISTSSLFAAGTAGNVLTYTTAGTWVPSATTTFSTGLTYASGNTTCDTASASVFGCLTSASFSKFNSATTTFTNGLSYSAGAASLSAIAANSILANVTGASAVPTALATSSFFSLTGATTITYASSTAITSSGSAYFATSGGSVGIGTTSPFRLLSMTSAVSTAQQAIAYDTANNTDILTSSVGDYFVYPSGDDALFNDSNLWVCTGGSGNTNGCPTGTPTTNGNLLVETRVGIATSTPRWELQVAGTRPSIAISDSNAAANLKHWTLSSQNGNLYFATSTDAYATSTIAAITVNSNGWVGIGTTTPSRELSTSGRLYVAAGGASGMGTATSTFQGDIKIVGKLDVGTIDPVYTIDGVKYATYGDSTIGIHEEVLQAITLSERGVNGKYSYTIDFDTLETGSDLWLFYQITDFGEDWKTLIVALTPGFDATVYYKKVPKENKLIIESSAPGEVSMRLSGNRFDFTKWGNLRTDQEDKSYKGFEINSKPVTISPAQSGTESAAQIATP